MYDLKVLFIIAAIGLAVTAAVKLKKKRRSGRAFAASAAACLLILGAGYYLCNIPICGGYPTICKDFMIDLTGLDFNECKSEYADYFYMIVDKEIYHSEYPAGTIIEHFPKGGSDIAIGSATVRCTVSKGPQMIAVPNTYTVDRETAGKMIEGVGLTYSFTNEYSETVPEGCVISTNPERNEMIEKGSTVNIVVSKGSEETFAEPEESELLINKEE